MEDDRGDEEDDESNCDMNTLANESLLITLGTVT
jgi:hypothetical protein